MQLSEKPKTFSVFLNAFLESTLDFKHFWKTNEPHSSQVFQKLLTPKDMLVAYLNAWKVLFLKTFRQWTY